MRILEVRASEELQNEISALDLPVAGFDIDEAETDEPSELDLKKFYEIELAKAQVNKFNDDNRNRKTFADNIFAVTVIWMFFILVIVYGSGTGLIHLSDSVLITLITTTTANVAGFLLVVVNYLFNKEKST